jgi:hypothetical protein
MATENKPSAGDFANAGRQARGSFVSEFLLLLKNKKKWWMLPLVLILLAFGVMMVLSSTGIAPFIYTVF